MKKVLLIISLFVTSVTLAQDTPDELKRNMEKWSHCAVNLDIQGILEYSTPELSEFISQYLPSALDYLSDEDKESISNIQIEALASEAVINDNVASIPIVIKIEENGEKHSIKFAMNMQNLDGTWLVGMPSKDIMPIEIDGVPYDEMYGNYEVAVDSAYAGVDEENKKAAEMAIDEYTYDDVEAVSATREAAEAAADAYIYDEVEAVSALDAETVEDTEDWGTPDDNGSRIEPVMNCKGIMYEDGVRVEVIEDGSSEGNADEVILHTADENDAVVEYVDTTSASVYYDDEGVEWAIAVDENPHHGEVEESVVYYVDGVPEGGYPNEEAPAVDRVIEVIEGSEIDDERQVVSSMASVWLIFYHDDNFRVLRNYSTPETIELLDLIKELKSNTSGATQPNGYSSYTEPIIDAKLIQFPTTNSAIVPYIIEFGEDSDRPTLTGRLHLVRASEENSWLIEYTQEDLDAEYAYMRDQ